MNSLEMTLKMLKITQIHQEHIFNFENIQKTGGQKLSYDTQHNLFEP